MPWISCPGYQILKLLRREIHSEDPIDWGRRAIWRGSQTKKNWKTGPNLLAANLVYNVITQGILLMTALVPNMTFQGEKLTPTTTVDFVLFYSIMRSFQGINT